MRTSPLGMRRRLRRAPLLLPTLALVVALGAACSGDGDGDDEGTSPTTTSPTTEATDDGGTDDGDDPGTTTEPAEEEGPTTSEATETGGEGGDTPGDDADVLTADQAEAQLDTLLAAYADALAGVRASGALDEQALVSFTTAFTTSAAQGELDGLQQVGAPAALNPAPSPLEASDVELSEAEGACASGSLQYEGFETILTTPPEFTQPFFFRLVPAGEGDPAPAWRIDFLRFGAAAEESSRCP